MASWRASQLDDVTLDSGVFSGTSSDKSSKKAKKRGSIGQNLTLSISGGVKSSSGILTNTEESLVRNYYLLKNVSFFFLLFVIFLNNI